MNAIANALWTLIESPHFWIVFWCLVIGIPTVLWVINLSAVYLTNRLIKEVMEEEDE